MKTSITKPLQGFTLIEVLISVLILGLGILGTLNLQTRALLDNQDAYLRSQAIILAYDMADRIRANAGIWRTAIPNNTVNNLTLNDANNNAAGAYAACSAYDPNPAGKLNPPIVPGICNTTTMAQYDVYRWQTDVANILNGGTATIGLGGDPNTASTARDVVTITITWGRLNQDMQSRLGNASFSLDVRP